MMNPIYLFSAQVLAATELAEQQFRRDVRAMERRRSANGSYMSGPMLQEVGNITDAVSVALCVKSEAALADAWDNSLWVTAREAQQMLEAAGTALARIRDLGLEQSDSLKRLKLPAGAYATIEGDIARGYDACRDRLLLFTATRQRAEKASKVTRVLGLFPTAVRLALRWLAGLVTR